MLLIERLHPREFQWEKDDYLDKLFGTNDLRVIAAQKKPLDHLPALWATLDTVIILLFFV